MSENSYVVVFPSIFAQKNTPLLIQNIKKILKIKNQQYNSIRKDGSIIIIDANDPVFASSAINLLFGIKRVAVARQVENKFEKLVSEISKIGSNLLLKGDIFYVKIEGDAKGFLPKDLEMAATSSIIEKSTKKQAIPGTEDNHNKLLYTFLTKSSGYVCIFSDNGLGGIPYGSQNQKMLCVIFDELSAVSCLETIKQGFDVEIIICYSGNSELVNLVKMTNQIIPRMVSKQVELEFFKINSNKRTTKNYLINLQVISEIIEKIAKKRKIKHVSLPLTPIIFPSKVIDYFTMKFYKQRIIINTPLGALEDEIYKNAKDIGIGKFISKIDKLSKIDLANITNNQKIFQKRVEIALKTSKNVSVKIGPNNLHEILNEVIEEGKD